MLSRRRQTRHLIHATFSPASSSSSSANSSHHFYSQAANLSITFSHSTPSIICSSSTAQPRSSSYETLKKQYASFSKTQNSSNHNGSLNGTTPNGGRRRSLLFGHTEFSNNQEKVVGSVRAGLIKTQSRAIDNNSLNYPKPPPELVMFKPNSDSLRKYPNGSSSSETFKNNEQRDILRKQHGNSNLNFLVEKQPSSMIYSCYQNRSHSGSETWQEEHSSSSVHHEVSLSSSWSNLGQLAGKSVGLADAAAGTPTTRFVKTFKKPEVNQKPIRVTIEPLWFAMSPLCSEPDSLETSNSLEEDPDRYPHPYMSGEDDHDETFGEMSSGLGEDENDHEAISNTLLAPIDIPGTQKQKFFSKGQNISSSSSIHSSFSSSSLNLLGGSSSENYLFNRLIPSSSNP